MELHSVKMLQVLSPAETPSYSPSTAGSPPLAATRPTPAEKISSSSSSSAALPRRSGLEGFWSLPQLCNVAGDS